MQFYKMIFPKSNTFASRFDKTALCVATDLSIFIVTTVAPCFPSHRPNELNDITGKLKGCVCSSTFPRIIISPSSVDPVSHLISPATGWFVGTGRGGIASVAVHERNSPFFQLCNFNAAQKLENVSPLILRDLVPVENYEGRAMIGGSVTLCRKVKHRRGEVRPLSPLAFMLLPTFHYT